MMGSIRPLSSSRGEVNCAREEFGDFKTVHLNFFDDNSFYAVVKKLSASVTYKLKFQEMFGTELSASVLYVLKI